MALIIADRVQETSTTTGTGAMVLGGAVTNFRTFSSVMTLADTTYYAIISGTQWEVGIGSYSIAPAAITRGTVLASSNSGSLVNFSAGTKYVFLDAPAAKLVLKNEFGYISSPTLIDAISLIGTITLSGSISGTVSVANSSSLATQLVTVNLGNFAPSTFIATNGNSGDGTTATVTWATAITPPAIGSQITIANMLPAGYNGTYTVTASTSTSASYTNATTGGVSQQGTVQLTNWAPVYSQSFSVSIGSTLWDTVTAGGNYITGSAYGGAQSIVYPGNPYTELAYGDELEMDGLVVSASLAATPNVNVYVSTTNGGPVVGPRQIALKLY